MAGKTIEDWAKESGLPVEQIIDNLAKAGVVGKKPSDTVTEEEILGSPQKSAPKARAKTNVSTLKVSGGGRGAATTVMVRKKRRKRKAPEAPPPSATPAEDAAPPTEQSAESAESAAPETKKADDAKKADEGKKAGKTKRAKGATEETGKDKKSAESEDSRRKKKAPKKKDGKSARGEKKIDDEEKPRRSGKQLHVASGKSGRRRPRKVSFRTTPVARPGKHTFHKPQDPIQRTINIAKTVSVADLANQMKIKAEVLLQQMETIGVEADESGILDQDTAVLLVEEMGHIADMTADIQGDEDLLDLKENKTPPAPRPPVVTVMGHVDHGKTTLLDYLRKTAVTADEAGGITQHIGAYRVAVGKQTATFLDTPGHAAFGAMRVRGANVTDIVVLVVAADDGVKEQTEESINYARAAEVPIIVAINKIDKPEADVERVRQELAKLELVSEEWGGGNLFVPISAKTGEGVDKLLEAILLQSEMMELQAPPSGPGQGVVVESSLDKGYGPMAMAIVKTGVIKKGDFIFAGTECGRVRLLLDENRKMMKEAPPSCPALIAGLSDVPEVGSKVWVVGNERKAREVAELRKSEQRSQRLTPQNATQRVEQFMAANDDQPGNIDLIVKADARGSVEALCNALQSLPTAKASNRIIASGAGGITESDVSLAATTKALVLGFNVRADKKAQALAQKEDVSVRYYSVIYEAVEGVKEMMESLIVPEVHEEIIGLAEVREVFNSSRLGQVAGSLVVDGTIKRGNPIRVLRDNVVVYEGELESLRRFKDDVAEVAAGTECGIAVKDYNDVKAGDQIEVYERVLVKATL